MVRSMIKVDRYRYWDMIQRSPKYIWETVTTKKADVSRKTPYNGSHPGLGLAIVQQLVNLTWSNDFQWTVF